MTSDEDRPYSPPVMTHARRADIERAAKAHAEVNRSDPFIYGRSVLHMTRGLVFPSEVLADATAQKLARDRATAGDQ